MAGNRTFRPVVFSWLASFSMCWICSFVRASHGDASMLCRESFKPLKNSGVSFSIVESSEDAAGEVASDDLGTDCFSVTIAQWYNSLSCFVSNFEIGVCVCPEEFPSSSLLLLALLNPFNQIRIIPRVNCPPVQLSRTIICWEVSGSRCRTARQTYFPLFSSEYKPSKASRERDCRR